ncbi:MAG: excinuclease ABC subunit UvrA, partial [Bacillota bacterium]|nr:excinuclease ABC subunit UvrA [Bacillota bacterium]
MKDKIIIKGARVNNLKNIDLEIPRDKLIVFTGLSGSGKTSLAFDTIYAEGQRRYVESLSSYARQFLGQMNKPDVDYIEGLSPAISIDQKTTSRNPRSTVGTVTEIYDYLRLLYAKIGVPHCPICGEKIEKQTVDQMADNIMSLNKGTKIQILSPIIRGRKGQHEKVIEGIKKNGFVRARIDGELYDLEEDNISLDKNKKHTIEAVVDRLVVKEDIRRRLTDSIETSLKYGGGLVVVNILGDKDIIFSENFSCPHCNISIEEIAPRLFSFNTPYGRCERCDGLGVLMELDDDLLIPDKNKSIKEGAIDSLGNSSIKEDSWTYNILSSLSNKYKFSLDTPVKELPKNIYNTILYGTDGEKIKVKYAKENANIEINHSYEGIMNNLKRRYRETNSDYIKREIEGYMSVNKCPDCNGTRLNKEALSVLINGINIYQFCKLSIKEEIKFLNSLNLSEREQIIGKEILKEIKSRLNFLVNVGLDYLDLNRAAATLSGGEAQRIRLATQIGSSLVGVLYILDEPSIGLHQRDNDRLIKTLKDLRDLGNTLIVVEHDEDTIREADYIVDIGPYAGE